MSWKLIVAVGAVVIILGGGFYWFSVRPSSIKKDCNKLVLEELKRDRDYNLLYTKRGAETYRVLYDTCISSKGV